MRQYLIPFRFVHCFEGRSRTPAVAATYSIRHREVPAQRALDEVLAVLPGNHLNAEFREIVSRVIRPSVQQ